MGSPLPAAVEGKVPAVVAQNIGGWVVAVREFRPRIGRIYFFWNHPWRRHSLVLCIERYGGRERERENLIKRKERKEEERM